MKNLIILALLIFPLHLLRSQTTKDDVQSKIQAQKVAFFTEKLQLTPAEAEKFWPLYNNYQRQKNKITNDRNEIMQHFTRNSEFLTDVEVTDLLENYINCEKKETEMLEDFNLKLREILPERKVLKVYIAEIQFKNWLLRQLRDNKPR
ncbi:MAG: hypothetical protein JXJ22_02585 [Bacteroidales bacterium]|nr:hypothetical protein [Bacteroidales bacterium]